MGKFSETGHIINIENFRTIIERCDGFGIKYNPSNAAISIGSMTARYTEVSGVHTAYQEGLVKLIIPINERQELFAKMRKIAVQAVGMYGCTEANAGNKRHAKALLRKITGSNVHVKKLHDGRRDPRHKSNSQLGFENRMSNFEELVVFLKADELYTPNEDFLKPANMQIIADGLQAACSKVYELTAEMYMLRNARDMGLYEADTGLLDISLKCKKYVQGLFGARSMEARTVTGIYLKRMMKRMDKVED